MCSVLFVGIIVSRLFLIKSSGNGISHTLMDKRVDSRQSVNTCEQTSCLLSASCSKQLLM